MDIQPITISHPAILEFYREHPHLDIVAMNLILIDILKTLSTNLSSTINNTVNSQILSIVSNIDKNMTTFKSDLMMQFNERLGQTKKEYIEDLKTQLTNNFLSNNEKISLVLDKTTDAILTKTSSIIHEVVPKSNDNNYKQIENCIKACCSTIEQDTKRLLETTNKETDSKSIVDNIENAFSKMVSTIQSPLFQLIQTSEERTNGGIQRVQNEFIQQQLVQERLSSELREFLNKYRNNSSTKGSVSEQELYFMLQKVMPSDEIIHVSGETATCDFRVNRTDPKKPSILFENKDYTSQVKNDEVIKFKRDLQQQQLHGIFLSQKSPIVGKQPFEIEIINGIIHVYIPNVEYDIDKLKIAINIIDNLAPKIELIQDKIKEGNCYIQKEDIEELIDEFHKFANQKAKIQESVKIMYKTMTEQLDELALPKIRDILVRFGALESNYLKCPYCLYEGRNRGSLGAHLRACKLKPISEQTEEPLDAEESSVETPIQKKKGKAKSK
jgi:hypothetical protein